MQLLSYYKRNHYKSGAEYCFYLLFFVLWLLPTIQNFGIVIIDHFLGIGELKQYIVPTIVTILSISSISFINRKVKPFVFILYIVYIICYFISYVLYPENEQTLSHYQYAFLTSSLWFFIGLTLEFEKIEKPLYLLSMINLLASSLYYLVIMQSKGGGADFEDGSGHLGSVSYDVLPSALWFVWHVLKDFNLKSLLGIYNNIIAILGFVLISSFGTRGPLVCLILYVVVYVFFLADYKYKKSIKTIILALGLFIYSVIDYILLFMIQLTSSLGMSSRIFMFASEGTFTEGEASSDERIMLLNTLRNELLKNDIESFFGHGYLGWGRFINQYPHNLIYDLVFCFGYILGGMLLLYLASVLIHAYRSNSSWFSRNFIIIISMNGFIQLFMSGSFWIQPYFYLLVGVCINSINSCKNKRSLV